jgi:hypothetical protein
MDLESPIHRDGFDDYDLELKDFNLIESLGQPLSKSKRGAVPNLARAA